MRKTIFGAALALGLAAAVPVQAQQTYIGQIDTFAFGFCPAGWHATDGSILPIMQYQALFSLLGTTYGGNGTTSFALPAYKQTTNGGAGNQPLTTCIMTQSSGAFPPRGSMKTGGAMMMGPKKKP
jgi:hypothetical protein